jgi:hypothetical protein
VIVAIALQAFTAAQLGLAIDGGLKARLHGRPTGADDLRPNGSWPQPSVPWRPARWPVRLASTTVSGLRVRLAVPEGIWLSAGLIVVTAGSATTTWPLTGWQVTAEPLVDCRQVPHPCGRDVVIVTYGCDVLSGGPPAVSNEHKQAGLFGPGEVPQLAMPDGCKRSIAGSDARLDDRGSLLHASG